jgi:Uma2 family endonuclease
MSSLPESHALLTVDELEAYTSRFGRCELIEGEVYHLSPSSSHHGMITARLHSYLGYFVLERGLGQVYAAETGFREAGAQTVRAPDLAFIQTHRVPTNRRGFTETMPDLVVETASPDDSVPYLGRKTAWWLDQPGVRQVWIVEPESKQVTVHHPDGQARVYRGDETLDGGDVLPGFELELTQLFA